MPMRLTCPSCKTVLALPDELLGKTVRCPQCKTPLATTAPAPAPNPASPVPVQPPTVPSPPVQSQAPASATPSASENPEEPSSFRSRLDRLTSRSSSKQEQDGAISPERKAEKPEEGDTLRARLDRIPSGSSRRGADEVDADEDEENRSPRRRSSGPDHGPRRRSRRDEDDEDDRRPRNQGGNLTILWVVLGIGGLLFVLMIIGVAAIFFSALTSSNTVVRKGSGKAINRDVAKDWVPGPDGKGPPPQQPEPPRAVELDLPALPRTALPIKAPTILEETTVRLPEPASAMRVGGGGRFLVLHLPKARQLALFDVNEGKIVRQVNVGEDDIRFAAGMTQLFVYLPGARLLQRYNLLTGLREASDPLPGLPEGKIEAFCMGHASNGPLLVGVVNLGARLYDPLTYRQITVPQPIRDDNETIGIQLDGGFYWAGATGRVFGRTGNYGQPNGIKAIQLSGEPRERYEHKGTWFVMPGPDASHVYAGGYGVMDNAIKPVPNVPFSVQDAGGGRADHCYLPATHGPFYFHAMTIKDSNQTGIPQDTVRIFVLGDRQPILTLDNTRVCKYGWEGLKGFGIEHSMQLIPQVKLFVVVPESRAELVLYPADLEKALDNLPRDYLVFTSSPPVEAALGKQYLYKATAKANKGPVTFGLERGPVGMTVSPIGEVHWSVPMDMTDKRVEMTLTAKSADGRETFQKVTLIIKK